MKKAKRKAQVRKAKPRKAASRGAVEATVRDLAQVSSLQAARIRELETKLRSTHELTQALAAATDVMMGRLNRLDPAGAPAIPGDNAGQASGDAAVAAGEPQAGEA